MLAFFWPSAWRVFQDGRNSLFHLPEASSCLSAPSLNTLCLLLSLSLLSIHFLITPPSPAVDLHPPPPNSTQLFSFWVIFIPAMFIHDRGSEREIRSQVLSWPPRAVRPPSQSAHTHSKHTHKHIFLKKHLPCTLT